MHANENICTRMKKSRGLRGKHRLDCHRSERLPKWMSKTTNTHFSSVVELIRSNERKKEEKQRINEMNVCVCVGKTIIDRNCGHARIISPNDAYSTTSHLSFLVNVSDIRRAHGYESTLSSDDFRRRYICIRGNDFLLKTSTRATESSVHVCHARQSE